jgi:hypothetical protein
VRCRTDSLHTGVFGAVISTGGNNVAVELAANFNAIFFNGCLGANLYAAVFDHFDAVNNFNFFQHDDFLSCSRIHLGFGLTIGCASEFWQSFQVLVSLLDRVLTIECVSTLMIYI